MSIRLLWSGCNAEVLPNVSRLHPNSRAGGSFLNGGLSNRRAKSQELRESPDEEFFGVCIPHPVLGYPYGGEKSSAKKVKVAVT